MDKTPQRVKLLDAFMAFLIVVGVLQFVYCVLAGNYVRTIQPSNSTEEELLAWWKWTSREEVG